MDDLWDDTWVVVPLYREEAVVGDVVRGLRRVFGRVVCVDDGSGDASGERAAEAGAVVVSHPVNLGQGAALQTGLEYALSDPTTRYLVTFDADGQHQVADAAAMVERLRTGEAEVVLGSRFLDRRTALDPRKRAVLRAATWHARLTTGLRVTDTHNGLRALTRRAAEHLDLTQSRMAHASQLLEQVADSGLPYVEHPVHVLYTDYSRTKGQSMWNSVNILTESLFR
ncbi:glycosyltransferase family 2 protein [Pseudokineococcus marinus]|uniref:Glycosyltransferase family 2 protein n=1 Tax=Pseudokineococcus marinus TaxID=351215 RepID=A0A849BSR1_9ACTN|nr:glycosyltransferase family 2 protein [Pseudokineococcus marinus]NNH24473.1 glycosyltransferase family 2 protein [Pseudokineococcus marinus]